MRHVIARVAFLALAAVAIRGTAWPATIVLGHVAFAVAAPPTAMRPFTVTPGPGSWILGLFGLALIGLMTGRHGFKVSNRFVPLWLRGACLLTPWLLPTPAAAQVHLNEWTTPDSGVSGSSVVWATGSAFPAHVSSVSVTVASSCGAPEGSRSAVPGLVDQVFGSAMKVQFAIPTGLSAGTYYAQVSGTETHGGKFSSDCAMVNVKASATKPIGCSQTSDILPGTEGTPGKIPVTAYVAAGAGGIVLAPIEGGSSPSLLATPTSAGQCVANPASGQVLCSVANTDPCVNDPQSCESQHWIVIEGSKIVWTGADNAELTAPAINPATGEAAYFSSSFFYIDIYDFG